MTGTIVYARAEAMFQWLLSLLLITVFGVAPTAARLAGAPGPLSWQPQAVLVSEFSATYVWASGSVLAADGYRVIAPTGGAPGRWVLQAGGRLFLQPVNGTTDDWPRVIGAANAMAGHGEIVLVRGASGEKFRALSQQALSVTAPVTIRWAPNTEVAAHIPSGIVFSADGFSGRVNPPGGAVTLANPAILGSNQVVVDFVHGLTVGAMILVIAADGTIGESHIVEGISGTTLTLSNEVLKPFLVGALVKVSPGFPTIRLLGAPGATISGQAEIGVEIFVGWDCEVRELLFAGLFTSWDGDDDWYCRRVKVKKLRFLPQPAATTAVTGAASNGAGGTRVAASTTSIGDGTTVTISGVLGTTEINGTFTATVFDSGHFDVPVVFSHSLTGPGTVATSTAQWAWAFEQTVIGVAEECEADQRLQKYTLAPWALASAHACWFVRCRAPNGTGGIAVVCNQGNGGASDTYGSRLCGVVECDVSGCTTGVLLRDGGDGIRIVRCYGPRCSNGVVIDAPNTGLYTSNVIIEGGDWTGCSNAGILAGGGDYFVANDVNLSASAVAVSFTGAGSTKSPLLHKVVANGCTGGAAVGAVGANVTGLAIVHLRARDAAQWALVLSNPDALIVDADITGAGAATTGTGVASITDTRVVFRNVRAGFSSSPGGIVSYGFFLLGTATAIFEDVIHTLPGSPAGTWVGVTINSTGATACFVSYQTMTGGISGAGGGATYGVFGLAAGTITRLGQVDLRSTTTPWTLPSGIKMSFTPNPVTLNGTVAVVINTANQGISPTFAVDAPFVLWVAANGGTPGAGAPIATPLSAGAFSVKSPTAACDDRIYWQGTPLAA